MYEDGLLSQAEARLNETSTPPYLFERGTHRPKPPVFGSRQACFVPFVQSITKNEPADVHLAYLRSGGGKCGKFLVEQGLVDRDLGVNTLDDTAAAFIDAHLAENQCLDTECSNSDLVNDIDVTQFLRNLATQAVMLNQDSPLGNGNNYYLAYTGNGNKWSMVQYDHNTILGASVPGQCDPAQCSSTMIKWSILRPTCRNVEASTQIAGPLLANDLLRSEYISHVHDFVNTVFGDGNLLIQIEDHLYAIQDLVAVDPWDEFTSVFEPFELALAKSDDWMQNFAGALYVPFLPALRARLNDVQMQLFALSSGTYPRTNLIDYNPGEACADWTAETTPTFICEDNCYYSGCAVSGLVARSVCEISTATCFKGAIDFDCIGIMPGESFEGSAPNDGYFCSFFDRLPLYVTQCSPKEDEENELPNNTDKSNKKKGKRGKKNNEKKKMMVKSRGKMKY